MTARFRVSQGAHGRDDSGWVKARDSPRDDLDGAKLVTIRFNNEGIPSGPTWLATARTLVSGTGGSALISAR